MRLNFKQIITGNLSAILLSRFFKKNLFKEACFLCVASDGDKLGMCRACYADLPWHTQPQCPQCGLLSNGLVCGACLSAPPSFDATRSLFVYEFPLDAMIQRYKYGNMLSLGYVFGTLLSQKINLANVDLVIPMPMHPVRLKERGFNQALEMAKIMTQHCPQKLDSKTAQRQKYTQPQASLPFKERVKNIKGAFKVVHDVTGQRIMIVDDVMTTGASLNELAKALKQKGASHVLCSVLARSLPRR